jgi:hypothetical protein
MSGLYPIIRRVRRPLLPIDVLPDGHQADAKPALAPSKPAEEAVIHKTNERVTKKKRV